VQRVVVDEDGDRSLGRQQMGDMLDDARETRLHAPSPSDIKAWMIS
jgi:hypothetical protein